MVADLPFTGERVIPGRVSATLYTRHARRYQFAGGHSADRRVLDIGCGVGYGRESLGNAQIVVSVDIDSAAAAECAERYPDALVVVADGLYLPFQGQSFDVVTCFEVVEHVPDGNTLLRNIKQVLEPRGTLIISTPNRRAVTPWWPTNSRNSFLSPFHLREYSPDSFVQLLARHFTTVELYGQWLVNLLKTKTWTSAKALLALSPSLYGLVKRRARREPAVHSTPVVVPGHGDVERFRDTAVKSHACMVALCRD